MHISKQVISVGNLVTWGNFGSNFLAAARLLCYTIFTGKYDIINFNMKITSFFLTAHIVQWNCKFPYFY